ncbi:MAG: glycosyltransferase family 39 protein [Candidatus Sungiibacteriota bacterium]|uniref:Glycosyltransferase family 39 protein n=1 Tax=Candidatus Sungiibacteriota bacterium TaxID=2750080 RepID=A0A7T5USA7_9BACT|nr:MAG: glycosyltransferase family 39 protein [Candidatus Sungbacteria bacterium]
MSTTTWGQKSILLALITFSLFFHLWQLGTLPLYDYDEAQYAIVVKDTIRGGDFWSLKRFGEDWIDKPPLLFWLTAGSVKVLGENEFAMRLPSALFGVAAVYGVYLLTRTLTNNFTVAVLSGFILLFSGIFPAAARQLRLDVPLSAAMIFGLWGFIRGWKNKNWYLLSAPQKTTGLPVDECGFLGRDSAPAGKPSGLTVKNGYHGLARWAPFWFFLGIGVMLRSFPALLLVPVILIFSAVYKEWRWLRDWYFWLGTIIFLIIILPWHLRESIKFGKDFWDVYLVRHVFERVAAPILGGSVTTRSYLKQLLLLNEPWFLAAIGGGLWIFWRRLGQLPERRLALASLFSALFIFITFAISRTKLIFYLIPLFPFEGMLVSSLGGVWYRSIRQSITGRYAVVAVFAALLLLGALSTYYQLFISNVPYSYPYAKEEKEIGLFIKKNDQGHALYSFDWSSFDTIYYYSGRKYIERVERESLKMGFRPPYFLIMPRPYLKNTAQPGLTIPFSGQYLVLLEAQADNSGVDK